MKSFRIPVGLAYYTVRFRKHVTFKGCECEGMCDPVKKEIIIAKADPDVMFTAFWHEFGHALFTEIGLEDWSTNESFIETFGQNLARVARHVPTWFRGP